jgi:hypothetical protein
MNLSWSLPSIGLLICLISVGLSGCGPEQPESGSSDKQSIVTAPTDYVAGTVNAGQATKGKVEIIAIQRAIESYQQQEGSNPASLDELVQKSYLKILPHPPVGHKFDYDAAKATIAIIPE